MSDAPRSVRFDGDRMWVELEDDRVIGVPLSWFPSLLEASSDERDKVELSSRGLHWDALDEDVSIDGLLRGRRDAATAREDRQRRTLVEALSMPGLADIDFDPRLGRTERPTD